MLDVSADSLLELIQACQAATRRATSHLKAAVGHYHGSAYDIVPGAGDHPENTHFEYVSSVLSRLVHNDPRVRIASQTVGPQKEVASALEHATNRWIRKHRVARTLQEGPILNMLFSFGVGMVTNEPNEELGEIPGGHGYDDEGNPVDGVPMEPCLSSVDPRLFWQDPLAWSSDEVRVQGHTWFSDKEDLLDLAKENEDGYWDLDAVKNLAEDSGVDAYRGMSTDAGPKRREVVLHTCWIPELREVGSEKANPEEGFHGFIFVMADQATGDGSRRSLSFVRRPQPYYGHPAGPYVIFGAYPVPGRTTPLAPLQALDRQIAEANAHAMAVMAADRSYKIVGIVNKTDDDLGNRLSSAKHGDILDMPRYEGQDSYGRLEVGGSSPQMRENQLWARERTDRGLGMDDAQRGKVDSNATATAVAVADDAAEGRVAWLQHQANMATEQVLERVAWYLFHDRRVVFRVGAPGDGSVYTIEETGDPVDDVWFNGGVYDEDEEGSFSSLDVEIDVYSMPRRSPAVAMQAVLDADAFMANVAPTMPLSPWVRWDEYLKWRAEQLNTAGMEQWFDLEVLAAAAQAGPPPAGSIPGGAQAQMTSAAPAGFNPRPVGRQSLAAAGPGTNAGGAVTQRQAVGAA